MITFENGKYILHRENAEDVVLSWNEAHQLDVFMERQAYREDIISKLDNRNEEGEIAIYEFKKLSKEQKEEIIDMIEEEYYNMQDNIEYYDNEWSCRIDEAIDRILGGLGNEYINIVNGLNEY